MPLSDSVKVVLSAAQIAWYEDQEVGLVMLRDYLNSTQDITKEDRKLLGDWADEWTLALDPNYNPVVPDGSELGSPFSSLSLFYGSRGNYSKCLYYVLRYLLYSPFGTGGMQISLTTLAEQAHQAKEYQLSKAVRDLAFAHYEFVTYLAEYANKNPDVASLIEEGHYSLADAPEEFLLPERGRSGLS